MLDVRTIKEKNEYTPGYYHNKKPIHGYYVYAKKGSLMERLEIYAKSKFKLEKDPENYEQEARLLLWMALDEYYDTFGEDVEDEEVKSWVYKVVTRKLMDMARTMKSNNSYYDTEKREFIINDIMYFQDDGNDDDFDMQDKLNMYVEEYRRTLMQESHSYFKLWLNENKSKILTKKQIGYLDGEIFIADKNKSGIHKNIVKRIDKFFTEESIDTYKKTKLKNKANVIDSILDARDEQELVKIFKIVVEENEWIEEEVYKLSFDTCKNITSLRNNKINTLPKKNIYEICDCLIKISNFIHNL